MTLSSKEQKPASREQKPIIQKVREWFRSVPKFWKGVGAVASVVATILGILPWVAPSLQPQPPSSETWADLKDVREGSHIPLGEYIQRPAVPAERRREAENLLSEEDKARVGSVIYFDVEVKGYEGETTRVIWSLYEADTGKAVGGLTNQRAWPIHFVEPRSQTRKLALETWVPFPREGTGPFLVSLEMFGGEGEGRLDYEEVTINTG